MSLVLGFVLPEGPIMMADSRCCSNGTVTDDSVKIHRIGEYLVGSTGSTADWDYWQSLPGEDLGNFDHQRERWLKLLERNDGKPENVYLNLLVAKGRDLWTVSGPANMFRSERWACIGSSWTIAEYLIQWWVREKGFPVRPEDAMKLGIYVIEEVATVDPGVAPPVLVCNL